MAARVSAGTLQDGAGFHGVQLNAEEKPRYFAFWWPLALTGLSMLLARQLQNGALARFPDAVTELAVFALASSTFQLFNATVGFVPQMTNVLARDRRDARTVVMFLLAASVSTSAPQFFLAFTPPGAAILGAVYGISGGTLTAVSRYMMLLSPLIVVNFMRQYNVGRLIQAGRTKTVTLLNVAYLAAVALVLVAGFAAGWGAVLTIAASQAGSALLHFALSSVMRWPLPALPEPGSSPPLSWKAALAYYWPVAVTSMMFALSRPAVYTFAARVKDPEKLLAALRVGFDFSMIFHDPLNQFRHLFATFGERDLPGIRRFMTGVVVAVTALMAFVSFTPPGVWVFEALMGLEPGLIPMVRGVMAGLCLIPAAVTVRNYFHGLALVRRRTGSMAAGGVLRLLVIFATSWILFTAGWLTPLGAGAALLSGFVAETVMVACTTARKPRDLPAPVPAAPADLPHD
jgi:O-antigen/teichoic acid export membrane protein